MKRLSIDISTSKVRAITRSTIKQVYPKIKIRHSLRTFTPEIHAFFSALTFSASIILDFFILFLFFCTQQHDSNKHKLTNLNKKSLCRRGERTLKILFAIKLPSHCCSKNG